jgi:hypothetical protein
MRTRMILTVLVLFLVGSQGAFAQGDINTDLSDYYTPTSNPQAAKANLDLAVEPLVDMFGFLSGGGLYNTAELHGIMGFDAGIRVTAMQVTDDQELPIPITTSTVPEKYRKGPLAAENIIPLPVLHVGVGLLPNLDIMGRFFSYPLGTNSDGASKGNISLIGLGAKYGILQNPVLPRVALVAAYHYVNTPKDFQFGSVNNISAAVVVSKGIPFISLYGGLGINYTTLRVKIKQLDFDETYTRTNFHGNVGLRISPIPFLFVNVDYNFGPLQGLSAGAGISIR